MSRLPLLTPDQLDADQKEVYDALTMGERGKNANLRNDDGSLVGPFNAMLYSPLTGNRFQALGEALRFFNKLPKNELEVVILVIARQWQADFEWWAHARLARNAGVGEDIIAAIHENRQPDFHDDGEALVYEVATTLLSDHRLDDALYGRAVDYLGEAALLDLMFLMAYYTGVSMVLNTFEVPLPEGVESPFE